MMTTNQDRAKGLGKDGHGKDSERNSEKDSEKDWQDLARLASQERDPDRLMDLVRKLNSALENESKDEGRKPSLPGPANPSQSGSSGGKLAEVA